VKTVDLTLRLRSIDDFFVTPAISPMSEWYERYSNGPGIDYVIGEIREVSEAERVALTVQLPADQTGDSLAERVQKGIGRYCDARLRKIDEDTRMSTWRAIRMLIFAGVMVAALTVAANHLDQHLDALAVLANVMAIASWVFLWRPIEVLVFQRWERRQDRRALLTARDRTDVRVVPIEPESDANAAEASPTVPALGVRGVVSPAR
jgi:hypothetical protein